MLWARFALVVVGIALSVTGAGCGSSSPAPLTKAEFVKQANAICRDGRSRKTTAIFNFMKTHQVGKSTRALEEKADTEIAMPPIQRMNEELRELAAPRGDEDKVNAIVDAFEAAVKSQEQNPGVVIAGSRDPFHVANLLAIKYGMNKCGEV